MELKILTRKEFKEYVPSLNRLFKEAFGKDIHPRFFEWRYLENPVKDLLVAVAVENDEVIANYSASPMVFKNNDRVFKTAISMTTMTHPEHNGKGLFTKLANLLYKEMENKAYSTVWGFPNVNSHGAFVKKLDWKDIYEIPSFSLDLSRWKKNEYSLPDSYEVQEDENYERINEVSISPKEKFFLEKSQQYYKWRYANHPYNRYKNIVFLKDGQSVGNIILKVYENSIDLVEFNFHNDDEQIIASRYLIDYGVQTGMETITCWSNVYENLHSIFERVGFQNTTPITYFALRNISGESMSTDFKDYIIQMGDSDVY